MAIAAVIGTVLLAVVALFQLALAAGAPLGDMAWGGGHPGVLPPRLRVASALVGLVIYPLIAVAILASAGLIDADWLPGHGPVLMWILGALLGLGGLANLASRSPRERIWGPVAIGIAICCAVIAIGL